MAKSGYVNEIFNYAKDKNVINNIVYEKSINHNSVKALYRKCDVFLLPTRYEIFGMVLLEAMYFGIPTITTLNGGSSVLIKDGQNGYICGLDNIEEWKKSIKCILENKENYLSINATKTIEDNFVWGKLVYKFTKEYEEKNNEK
ncbi:MAG: glycosyltransferase [Clostridia bacterium]|nr:glycosyltransferase [Clostridium sp.]MBS6252925.1 glycosyltransferase [Clostridium sp.]